VPEGLILPQVVILAGGLGTRLGSQTRARPKALVDVNGEPFAARQLNLLASNGFRRVLICVGYRGELIEECIGRGEALKLEIKYSREEEGSLLGTAGALKKAEPLLDSHFLLLYGDSYLDFDYRAFVAAFREKDYDILLSVYENAGRYDRSNVRLVGEKVIYDKINPDPEMKYIDYGAAILRRRILRELSPGQAGDLAEVYSRLSREGRVGGWITNRRFYEVGSPDGLREFRDYLRSGQGGRR